MTMTDRDRLIRAALMPPAELTVPADLGEQIHARLVETPQRRPGLTRYVGPFRRLIPETPIVPRPAVVWLTALLLVLLALLAVIGVASRLQDGTPLSMTSYHGGPAQDGIMPGPGPAGVPRSFGASSCPGRWTISACRWSETASCTSPTREAGSRRVARPT